MMTLAAILHRIDPFLIELQPGIGLRWYGLAYLAGAVIGYGIVRWMAGRGRAGIEPPFVFDFAFGLLIGAFLGGRLGYCLLYEPKLLGFVPFPPFWGVLALQKGGMSSHGGFIGMIVAAWWFARKHKISLLHLLDLACLAGPPGIFLGRLANYVNGELFGRPAPAGTWWSVKFPQEILGWRTDQLAPLAEATEAIGIKQAQWFDWLGNPQAHQLELSNALSDLVVAVQLGNENVIRVMEPLLTARYPSQLFQALFEGLLVFVLVAIFWTRPRKPGTVAGLFVVLYAVARIIGEQFRMPDAEIGFELFGLTRGQELSILMLVAGVVFMFLCSRRAVPKQPGWIGPLSEPTHRA